MLRLKLSILTSPFALAGMLSFSAAIAAAEPPPNDLRSNATVVSALPFTEQLDTTGATSSADDVTDCSTGTASVWYTYTGTPGTQLVADVLGSDYAAVVHIFPDAFPEAVNCALGFSPIVTLGGLGGQTVSIQISDAFSGDGGNLVVAIYEPTPPPNDEISAAATISALPYKDTVELNIATTDADDVQVNDACGFILEHTVWYTFTAGSNDTSLFVDTYNINTYPADIVIATGSPGALTTLTDTDGRPACGFGQLAFYTTPGTTYYVLLNNVGGRIPLTVSEAPPQPSMTVSFDPQGTISTPNGSANLTGTYECIGRFGGINVEVAQTGGRHVIRAGEFGINLNETDCDGNPHPFNALVAPNPKLAVPAGLVSNPFIPGQAVINGYASACNGWGCNYFPVQSTVVQLKR